MTTLLKPVDGNCANCGASNFFLAQDKTEYSPCEYDEADGTFFTTYRDTQNSEAENSVRFFCTSCGAQHEVPEGLT
jgi:hypothetical protein